jgi:hypothetical protein
MFAQVEPPHTYVRDSSAPVVHHTDYLGRRDDHTLCGIALAAPTATDPADAICPACEARLIEYHLVWWRETAEAATAELAALRAKYRDDEPAPSPDRVATPREASGDTFLDRARQELVELSRQFNGSVPYFRLKNAMQAFSDKLDDAQRVELAREIGADGSLIRWATTEVEHRGWQVTNSPVHENTEMMWEEWLQESQPPATKTRRRFGRSR